MMYVGSFLVAESRATANTTATTGIVPSSLCLLDAEDVLKHDLVAVPPEVAGEGEEEDEEGHGYHEELETGGP